MDVNPKRLSIGGSTKIIIRMSHNMINYIDDVVVKVGGMFNIMFFASFIIATYIYTNNIAICVCMYTAIVHAVGILN